MSKKKQSTVQNQTNTYGWQTPPSTADTNAYRDAVNTSYDKADPTIGYAYDQQRSHLMDRYDNPFSANYSPEARDAAQYAGVNDLNQQQGAALQADAFNRKQAKVGGLAGVAGMTAPVLTQTGGNMNSTTTQSGGLLGSILGAAAGVGQAALM